MQQHPEEKKKNNKKEKYGFVKIIVLFEFLTFWLSYCI